MFRRDIGLLKKPGSFWKCRKRERRLEGKIVTHVEGVMVYVLFVIVSLLMCVGEWSEKWAWKRKKRGAGYYGKKGW